MELNKIFNEDCLEGMKRLPNGCVDLIVTDPPYEVSNVSNGGGHFGNRDYYHELSPMSNGITNEFIDEMVRVCKIPNMYLFCSKFQLPQLLNYAVSHNLNFDILAWYKTNPIPACENTYLSDTEYIVFMRGKGARLYGSYETKSHYFLTAINKEDKDTWHHPTIKPLNIIETLIVNSSERGGVILDPFMGSGTTAVAAIKQKRNYIGFELNPEYYKICEKRVALQNRTLTLF